MRERQRFLADAMLGSLARWLRALGCDVAYERHIDDGALIQRALSEGRIVLTRDTLLAGRRALMGRCLLVRGGGIGEQLRQVVESFDIKGDAVLTRCLRCGSALAEADRASVKGLVPEYVLTTQARFSTCPTCGRIYWGGTHRVMMLKGLSDMLGWARPVK